MDQAPFALQQPNSPQLDHHCEKPVVRSTTEARCVLSELPQIQHWQPHPSQEIFHEMYSRWCHWKKSISPYHHHASAWLDAVWIAPSPRLSPCNSRALSADIGNILP